MSKTKAAGCNYSDTNSPLTSIIAILSAAPLVGFIAVLVPVPLSSLCSPPPSSSSLCPPVPVGVREFPRRVRGPRLRPPRPLHPRCALLVRGPLLLHRLHVGVSQGVQDQPLLSHQGTCHAVLHQPADPALDQFRSFGCACTFRLPVWLEMRRSFRIKRLINFAALHLLLILPWDRNDTEIGFHAVTLRSHFRLCCHLLVVELHGEKCCSLCGHSMCKISMIYHWDDSHERNMWRDAGAPICSQPAPPCGDECDIVTRLLV